MASTRMLTLACAVAVALCAATTDAKTVAIADVGARSEKSLDVFEGMVKAAGHEVRRITGPSRTLENESAYEGADVVILTGGWNDSRFPSVAACRGMIRASRLLRRAASSCASLRAAEASCLEAFVGVP